MDRELESYIKAIEEEGFEKALEEPITSPYRETERDTFFIYWLQRINS